MVIRDIMTRTVVTAATHTPVREVAEIMRERNVGGVVLCAEDGAPAAFITERDVAVSVVAAGRDALAPASDHASSPVVTGEPDMDLREAATLMARFGIRRLPVLEDGRLAGRVEGPLVDAGGKARHVARLRDALGLPPKRVLAIGDGANDLMMMGEAGTSIAFRAKPVVRGRATYALSHAGLEGVLALFPA